MTSIIKFSENFEGVMLAKNDEEALKEKKVKHRNKKARRSKPIKICLISKDY